ncbi:MAG: DUF1800 domain-containing protein [Ferruginibacter sp.]
MKKIMKPLAVLFLMGSLGIISSSFYKKTIPKDKFSMPYRQAGLTPGQAAAHLLDRFAFGPTPGDVDAVVNTGLEKWFEQQLDGKQDDTYLTGRLKEYDALAMSNEQVLNSFPRNTKILKSAVEEGAISKEALDKSERSEYKQAIKEYMDKKGYRPEPELLRQFVSQKVLSAAYSKNQLQQVLTEFWFNHFNVSATKNDCSQFIPAYERDVIRPNATGKFSDLLLATAQSPAMLFYLDNFNSSGVNEEMDAKERRFKKQVNDKMESAMEGSTDADKAAMLEKIKQNKKERGLNENYAREIMELHTLGVDGGYTQKDVTEAAKILTGWTVFPIDGLGKSGFAKKLVDKFGEDNLTRRGFVHKGDFFFAMNRHDTNEKTVLGKTFAAGRGYDEGVELISMLANHPSTAKFISRKLAVKFVSDNPPQSLIDKMAASFTKTGGDIKQVLVTMVSAPEFWSKDAVREKTKSPFELTISAVRAVDAKIDKPFMLYQWISKMGQKLYYYQAPTGFPDKGEYWINTGSLLNRMKFGLAFAAQKIPGVSFSLAALNNNKEPESAAAALATYCRLILPERNLDATIKRLTPLINDPAVSQKIDEAAGKQSSNTEMSTMQDDMVNDDMMFSRNSNKNMSEEKLAKQMLNRGNGGKETAMVTVAGDNSMLAQVVGIILGSPEFQRR